MRRLVFFFSFTYGHKLMSEKTVGGLGISEVLIFLFPQLHQFQLVKRNSGIMVLSNN